jgi:hypothetical protein
MIPRFPGLGSEFLEEANQAALRLAECSEIHRIRFADVRRIPVHRFKYYARYYLIRNSEVWVIAVHQGSRHPRWLRERRRRID